MIGTIKGIILALAGAVPFFVLVIWPDVPGGLFIKICGAAVALAAISCMIPGGDKKEP